MVKSAIKVENLGKRYLLGELNPYGTLRDLLSDKFSMSARKQISTSATENWALSDVSFSVPEGEVLGIVGKNGAGKSTLLKILTQITRPSTGNAIINGRIGALLEVGTGFHNELTGRENIFFNGAILGMSRNDIKRMFDQIVDFAGVEQYLDTPVKRYSSGMKVRLAFAVAAHLEPEILIIDEVLAVGDAEFQKKCLGRMQDVATEGRTVLFVSHQLDSILNLCSRCLCLNKGKIINDGTPEDVITAYLRKSEDKSSLIDGKIIKSIEQIGKFKVFENIGFRFLLKNTLNEETSFRMKIVIVDSYNRVVCRFMTDGEWDITLKPDEERIVDFEIPETHLVPGDYHLHCTVFSRTERIDMILEAQDFTVLPHKKQSLGSNVQHTPTLVSEKYTWS